MATASGIVGGGLLDSRSHLAAWWSWINAPWKGDLSLLDWLLLTILATTVSYLWTVVLKDHMQVEKVVGL